MSFEIRPITRGEFPAFVEADSIAFGYTPDEQSMARTLEYMQLDRTLAAFDGDELVATTCIFSFDMSVPGGRSLPTAGVSWVSVKPTHTRKGIMTSMMQRQLSDVRDCGEPMAALLASESLIYGRFGYGLAAQNAQLSIERRYGRITYEVPPPGKTRLVDRKEALAKWPACYERARLLRPGLNSRSAAWWEHRVLPDTHPEGGKRRTLAQYEEDGTVRGFVRFEWAMNWGAGAEVRMNVGDLVAETRAAYVALWKLVFSTDLVTHIRAPWRPADEPLYHMLADPRRLRRELVDSLWLRIVDVPAALEGRAYAREGRITLRVHDDFCDWVDGTYTLEVGPEGARCTESTRAPDVELHVRDLGAAFLGGTRLSTLAEAGRIDGDDRSIALADQLFAWHVQPYAGEMF